MEKLIEIFASDGARNLAMLFLFVNLAILNHKVSKLEKRG